MTKVIPAHVLTLSVQVPEWVPTHAERGLLIWNSCF